jgi:hypothetical protein
MRRRHQVQSIYRRTLATAGAVVALATAACGSPIAGLVSTPDTTSTASPVTADSVRAAFDNSKMKSAHFRLYGTLIKKPTYFPVTGDGVFQLRPREALQMNIRVQTYSTLGVLKIQEVTIGGRLYSRIGNGRWTSTRTSDSPTMLTDYVGEETLAGTKVWHARSTTASSTYDIWIRETDGYPVQLMFAGTSGTFHMTFDSYNKSKVIAKP